jgi:hypothetical protein
MRRFGAQLDKGDTVTCMAGSQDLMHGPLPDKSGGALQRNSTARALPPFGHWPPGPRANAYFVNIRRPQEAGLVFDFASGRSRQFENAPIRGAPATADPRSSLNRSCYSSARNDGFQGIIVQTATVQ